MKIVIDRDIPYIKGVLEPFAGVVYLKGTDITAADVADADAMIIRTRTRCDSRLLAGSRVRLIASATIGYDHIDMDYCAQAGIRVATAAGSNARGVLQWVGAALAHMSQAQGWQPRQRTLGVVGVGHVGSLIYDYARRWGLTVLGCDPPRRSSEGPHSQASRFVELGQIAERCDIITFHTPLSATGPDATRHMAGTAFFDTLRPGTLILNSSRGEVVDTQSLVAALSSGACDCCIDTWEHEPAIDGDLLRLATVATPHIAGYSAQGKANATSMMVRAVAAEYGFPLAEWYPAGEVRRVRPAAISWADMCATIGDYFDIAALSASLKSAPQDFEEFRNSYTYRQEYF